jgi:dynein heavy chain
MEGKSSDDQAVEPL